jgi:signal peptidase I
MASAAWQGEGRRQSGLTTRDASSALRLTGLPALPPRLRTPTLGQVRGRAVGILGLVVLVGCGGGSSSSTQKDADTIRALFPAYARTLRMKVIRQQCASLEKRDPVSAAKIAAPFGGDCVTAFSQLQSEPTRLQHFQVTTMHIVGNRAEVTVRPGGGAQQTAEVRRTKGHWVIERLGPAHAPGSDHPAYRILSTAMAPTYAIGRTVFANPHAYERARPRYGDVILLHPPNGYESARCRGGRRPGAPCGQVAAAPATDTVIKRVVGLPGDRIAVRHGRIIRNGQPDRFARLCHARPICDMPRVIRVSGGAYFVAGDKRAESNDSRDWGPVRLADIIGRVDS